MQNLTRSQQKIIIVTVAVIVVFFIVWLLLYIPTTNGMNQYKIELNGVQSQIQQIEMTFGQGKSIEEGMRLLTERYRQLDAKFPLKEEEGLRLLSDMARQLNVEIVSTKLQPKKEFEDSSHTKVQIDGKTCQELKITIDVRSTYKDLVEYIKTLKEQLPVYITVENLKINKASREVSPLNVTLEINFYLLS